MNKSRLQGLPPGLRNLPRDDQPPGPETLLTQPFSAGMTGWVVVCGAVIAEVAAGIAVANQMSAVIAVPVLIFPVVVAFGFAVVQWWQVRWSAAEPASWWHLAGVAIAALTWLLWPTVPAALAETGAAGSTSNARTICFVLPSSATPECLHRAAQAFDDHYLAWWSTSVLILLAALLTRRSRIAAWAAIPAAFAGCELATFFLNQFVLYYHLTA